MRLIALLLLLLVIAAGTLFGAINATPVTIDLHFVQWRVSVGVALLVAIALGWLLGGVVAWGGQWGCRRRVARAAERQP